MVKFQSVLKLVYCKFCLLKVPYLGSTKSPYAIILDNDLEGLKSIIAISHETRIKLSGVKEHLQDPFSKSMEISTT